jgi:hypothetical protein
VEAQNADTYGDIACGRADFGDTVSTAQQQTLVFDQYPILLND